MSNLGVFLGMALAPLFLFILTALFGRPVRIWIERRMPECALKRFFLISWKV